MGPAQAPLAAEMLEFAIDGGTVQVMSRPAYDDRRLFEPQSGPTDSGAALAFPDDPRISIVPVEILSVSLPGAPDGLTIQMDERGDGTIYALGDGRIRLGSDGMWWIVNCLIEALEDPQTVATWPRFLTIGGHLGGPATQASLQWSDQGISLVWRRLSSGVVGSLIAMQEISHERAQGWLTILRPALADLERRRIHQQRLLPARAAERWAHFLERRSA